MASGRKMWKRVAANYTKGVNHFPNKLVYKRFYNQKKMEQNARAGRLYGKVLDSGFFEGQTWGGLLKAWLAYIISFKHNDWERRKYYAAVIQKLEGELQLEKYDFEEVKHIAAHFLEQYQDEPDIRDMSVEEIEEIMRKSDTEFWRQVNG